MIQGDTYLYVNYKYKITGNYYIVNIDNDTKNTRSRLRVGLARGRGWGKDRRIG